MSDRVAEFFGYGILVTAAVLFTWETFANQRQQDSDTRWLHTPSRFRRRLIMAVMLVIVGVMIVLEARDIIVLERISHLVVYVTSLCVLAVALFILSIRDLGDMARNAERQAVDDLKLALEERNQSDSGDAPPAE
jgi:hypothetical protein